MASLPLLKMATLLVRTASKPIANRVKQEATSNPAFRKACIFTGQFVTDLTNTVNVRLLGHQISKLKPLNEEAAVARGADIMGEAVIYFISVATISFEVARQNVNSNKKEAEKIKRQKQKQQHTEETFEKINERFEQLEAKGREIELELDKLERDILLLRQKQADYRNLSVVLSDLLR